MRRRPTLSATALMAASKTSATHSIPPSAMKPNQAPPLVRTPLAKAPPWPEGWRQWGCAGRFLPKTFSVARRLRSRLSATEQFAVYFIEEAAFLQIPPHMRAILQGLPVS
jgi:hypothetical protein